MSEALRIDGGELPSTTGVRGPRTRLLSTGRFVLGGRDPRRGGTSRSTVPTTSRVRAGRDGGQPRRMARRTAAGDLLPAAGACPDQAGDVRGTARSLPPIASGQIPLDRFHVDLAAIRLALRTLEDGHVVGVFPEGARGPGDMTSPRAGAAYLALVTGAPVVPVSFLGTRLPGGDRTARSRRAAPASR